MKINAILFFLLPVFISGCNRSAPQDATVPSDQIVSLQNSLTADEARISVLEKQIKYIGFQSGFNYTMINTLTNDNAEISTTEPGYGIGKISGGYVLIQVGHVESYLDGVKVTLSIGNPLYSDLTNCTLTTYYGPDITNNDAPEKWRQTAKFVTTPINNNLLAGRWTNQDVVIPAVAPATCRHLSVYLECKGMSLLLPQQPPPISGN